MNHAQNPPIAVGTVTPPADMMAAARASLSPEGFEELMRDTGGGVPTPAQLCRIADRERLHAETDATAFVPLTSSD